MKAIIIDDEQHCIKTLHWTLAQYCPEVEIVATAENGTNGKNSIEAFNPDIVFLDIEMPMMNGIDMLKSFEEIDFEVIFTTAYDKYAINAIKLNALDYLLKPIDKDELIAAVDKIKTKKLKIDKLQIDNLHEVHKTKIADKIAITTIDGLQFITLQNIIRIEADGSYSIFYLLDGKKILLSKKLGDVQELLSNNLEFFRPQKSHIINLKFVEKYIRTDGGEIIMVDNSRLALSRNKKDEFLEMFAKI
jgi:two-component system LytT family response regulator